MKACKDIEELLPLFLDERVSPREQENVRRHLDGCASCAEKLAALKKTRALVTDLGEVPPPPWLRQNIMAAVRDEAEKKRVWERWFYPLPIKVPLHIAATLVVAVFAVYVYRAGEGPMKKITTPPAPVAQMQQKHLPPATSEISEKPLLSEKAEKSVRVAVFPKKKPPKTEEGAEVASKPVFTESRSDSSGRERMTMERASPRLDMEHREPVAASDVQAKTGGIFRPAGIILRPDIVVAVTDVEHSEADVEKMLLRFEAQNIVKRMKGDGVLLTAEMNTRKLMDIIVYLKQMGHVDVNESFPADAEGVIPIVIEISKK